MGMKEAVRMTVSKLKLNAKINLEPIKFISITDRTKLSKKSSTTLGSSANREE
jgi:hypothetical protein